MLHNYDGKERRRCVKGTFRPAHDQMLTHSTSTSSSSSLLAEPVLANDVVNKSGSPAPRVATACPARRVGGFFCSWSRVDPSSLHTEEYTYLVYAFLTFSPSTYVVSYGSTVDSTLIPKFIAQVAKSPCCSPIMSIGGSGFTSQVSTMYAWSHMAASPTFTATFVNSAVSFARSHGFTGIDIVRHLHPAVSLCARVIHSVCWCRTGSSLGTLLGVDLPPTT